MRLRLTLLLARLWFVSIFAQLTGETPKSKMLALNVTIRPVAYRKIDIAVYGDMRRRRLAFEINDIFGLVTVCFDMCPTRWGA